MYHSMNADMLVGTARSFPLIAHTITTKAFVLEFMPNEGPSLLPFFDDLSEIVHVDHSGKINTNLGELHACVLVQHALYKEILIP